ncbi:MAG: Ig domain-containing protein [Gaiellaceae bacterium]
MGRGRTRSIRFGLVLALVAALAGVVAATAAALAFDDAVPCVDTQPLFVCPQGTVDGAYSIQFIGRGGCGPDPPNEGLPYQFRVINGALPPGLSLSQGGQVSGTPPQAGTYRFWVELSDQDPPSQSWCLPKKAEREFSITINPRVLVTTESTGPGTIGSPYTLNLTAVMKSGADSTAPPSSALTWTLTQGQLPVGLTLDSSTGVISGSPTTEGASSFVVRAALVDGRADTKALTITVKQALAIQALKPLSAAGTPTIWEVGVPFTAKLAATGGTGTYTWTLAEGALPTGLALAADGTVAGRPNAAGAYRATLRLTDSEGRTADYPAVFGVASRLAVSTLKLRTGKVGRLYRAKVVAAGGVLPKKWKIKRGPLPRGIRFDRTLGVLSGTPTRPGRYRVTFEATDGLKVKAVKTLVIEVLA